jgi:opacity protein-like surface antigen
MRRLGLSAIILGSALAVAGESRAADAPFPPPLVTQPLYATEFVSALYLRGDVGYRFFDSVSGSIVGVPFSSASYSNVVAFDAGFGFKAKWFRGDITATYAVHPRFFGATAVASPDVQARINAITTLFNGYFDLGTWRGFTPYVGAGIGFSWIRPMELATVTPIPSANSPGTWDTAWALHAGVAFAVARNWLVDASYRYLHVGSPKTFVDGIGTIDYGHMNAQEARIGLRYLID